jgi:hypothetical protein
MQSTFMDARQILAQTAESGRLLSVLVDPTMEPATLLAEETV